MNNNVVWKPQPRQAEFMRRAEDEALYGGSAGGGKSDALVIEATRQVHIPYYKALIIRKTYPQLTELIEKSQRYYPAAFPNARYNDSKHTWVFPSGAKIVFGSMQHAKDKLNYQGKAYDFVAFDELTHFTYEEYVYLKSRNRPNGPGTRCYIRSTANPGGVGHAWVKERFIDPGTPGETVWEKVKVQHPNGKTETKWYSRVFVPSSVFDNQILLDNDPAYLVRLASLPEAERNALLYGDWDSFEGRYFSEFDRSVHVVQPFPIPSHWRRYRALDYGLDATACVWVAVNEMGEAFVYKEYVESDLIISAAARNINDLTAEDEKIYETYAPPDLFSRSQETGKSRAEIFHEHGLPFIKSSNDRVAGWQSVAEWLHPLDADEGKISRLRIFSNCTELARCLPLLMRDKKNPSDCDTEPHEITHICDALRYFCSQRPVSAKPLKTLDAESEMLIEAKRRAIGGNRTRGQRF